MNLESEKCLDVNLEDHIIYEMDCNQSTTKRWILLNDGNHLCYENSTACMSVPIAVGHIFPAYTMAYPIVMDDVSGKNKLPRLHGESFFLFGSEST